MRLMEIGALASDFKKVRAFLQERSLLLTSASCSTCGRPMKEVKNYGRSDPVIWRCSKHREVKRSIRIDSFFYQSKLSLGKLLLLLYLWGTDTSVKSAVSFSGHPSSTISKLYQYCRDVCSNWLAENPFQVGGSSVPVQMSEFTISKARVHGGKYYAEKLVICGYDEEKKIGFAKFVEDRSTQTFLKLLEQYVAPGSIISSDCLAAYGLSELPGIPQFENGYIFQYFKHSVNAQGEISDSVEQFWKDGKMKFKQMCGVQAKFIQPYLDEVMWRQFHEDAFESILQHLSMLNFKTSC